jgi:hypothetical protein
MAARSIEAFALREDSVDLELRFCAHEGGVRIEVRVDGDPVFMDVDAETTRALRLAIEKCEKAGASEKAGAPK